MLEAESSPALVVYTNVNRIGVDSLAPAIGTQGLIPSSDMSNCVSLTTLMLSGIRYSYRSGRLIGRAI
jgi:hypothetical protein